MIQIVRQSPLGLAAWVAVRCVHRGVHDSCSGNLYFSHHHPLATGIDHHHSVTSLEKEQLLREQDRRIEADFGLRCTLFRAASGRTLIWEVVWEGEPIAELIAPRLQGQNWVSYEISPLDTAPAHRELLQDASFWLRSDPIYRNRATGLIAPHAFAASDGPRDGRISIQGLCFRLNLTHLDKLCMHWHTATEHLRSGR